jgi:hypothetical protein
MENAHNILVGKLERKIPLGRPRRGWEYNINTKKTENFLTNWATITFSMRNLLHWITVHRDILTNIFPHEGTGLEDLTFHVVEDVKCIPGHNRRSDLKLSCRSPLPAINIFVILSSEEEWISTEGNGGVNACRSTCKPTSWLKIFVFSKTIKQATTSTFQWVITVDFFLARFAPARVILNLTELN